MEDRTEGRGVTAKVVREKRKEQRALAQAEAEERKREECEPGRRTRLGFKLGR